MRIALFSEVYWPMVSGVGVTLLRLTEALQARGHELRVYSATYPLPPGRRTVPKSIARPACRSSSIPMSSGPSPGCGTSWTTWLGSGPTWSMWRPSSRSASPGVKAARQLGLPAGRFGPYRLRPVRRALRRDWALRAGWHYLRWFYGQAHKVLCPSRIYEQHLHSRGVLHTGVWTRGVDPDGSIRGSGATAIAHDSAWGPTTCWSPTSVGSPGRRTSTCCCTRGRRWRRFGGSARLALVGRGPLEDEIRRREIAGVHVTGLLQGRDLSAAYASADLFAFPSATETFGNSLLEAMASGLPSLVAASGGVLDFSEHGRNAWLVAPDSAEAHRRGPRAAAHRSRPSAGALPTARSKPPGRAMGRRIRPAGRGLSRRRGRGRA